MNVPPLDMPTLAQHPPGVLSRVASSGTRIAAAFIHGPRSGIERLAPVTTRGLRRTCPGPGRRSSCSGRRRFHAVAPPEGDALIPPARSGWALRAAKFSGFEFVGASRSIRASMPCATAGQRADAGKPTAVGEIKWCLPCVAWRRHHALVRQTILRGRYRIVDCVW